MSCVQDLKRFLTLRMPEETILVTSSVGEGRRLLNACIRDGGLVAGVHPFTPLMLAVEILADTSDPCALPRLLSRGEQQDLVYQVLAQMPADGFFALEHVKERKSAELFHDVIRELNRENIGKVSGNGRLDALQRVREAYQEKKAALEADEADLLKYAIRKAASCDCFRNTAFIVLSCDVFPALDRQLVELIAGDNLSVIRVDSPTGLSAPAQCFASGEEGSELNTENFRFWKCRGIEAETEAVMRDILSTERQAEDCALIFMSPEYQAAISKAADLLHVPVSISGGIPVTGSSSFAVIQMLNDWERTDFNAEELRALILNDLITFPGDRRFAQKMRSLNIGWGEQRYFECLTRDRKNNPLNADTPYDDWEKLLRLLFSVSKRKGTLEEQKAGIKELLDQHIKVRREEDASALAMTKTLLDQISWLEEDESVLGRLKELMSGANCMSHQEQPGKLFALPLQEAFCTGRKYLYICGMSRFCLQGGQSESPVFLDVERKRFNLPDRKDREELNTFRLLQMLSQHEGEAVLSYSGFDTERMIDLEPALLYRELLGGREPENISLVPENCHTVGDVIASGAMTQVIAPASASVEEEIEPAELKSEETYEQQLNDMVFSASSMEMALECPFKFYVEKILRLHAENVPEKSYDQWLAVNDFGKLCHEVLSRYYSEPGTNWREILEDEVVKMKEQQPAGPEEAVQADIREAERMISRAIAWTDSQNVDVLATELGFGPRFGSDPLTLNFNGKTIRMSGSIDRVDRTSDGSVSIIDYKTGKAKYYRDHLDTKLQPYLYSRAAKRLDQELDVRKAGYLFLKDSAFYLQAWSEKDGVDKESNKIASLLDWISTESGALTDAPDFTFEENGAISGLGNRDKQVENCKGFCDYFELCTALRKMRADRETGGEVTENA